MTVAGLGGGAFAGIVNMPHAEASDSSGTAPQVQLAAKLTTVKPVTVTAASLPAAPTTTVAPVVHKAAPAPAQPAAAPKPAAAPEPERQAVATAVQTRSQTPAAPVQAATDSCSAALSYLRANSAPGFTFQCPGYALGHQAMTCVNVSGVCPGERLIVISTVCQASYMNEAHNSWIEAGYRTGSIDPYGYCH